MIAALRAECKRRNYAPNESDKRTCNPYTENTPSGAARRLLHKESCKAYPSVGRRTPPLRGGCACAAAPRPTASSKEPRCSPCASRRRSVGRRAPTPAAKRLTFVAASASFPPLLRAGASVRHIACGAGARRAAAQAPPPRIGSHKCKLPFTSVNASNYKCKLPQVSRAQAAEYQPSSAPLVKYYEGKSVRCTPNPLIASRLHA